MAKVARVLISGAGVAGPALAWWLARWGVSAVVVERAPALRVGGQAVDFRGPVHREVLTRMGLWDAVHARRTATSPLALLDAQGRRFATLPSFVFGGDVEVLRGDLCALLHERTAATTEYRFGERVVGLDEDADGVTARFAGGAAERFDLVVGADGLHSGVRALRWGDESALIEHQGSRLASFDLDDAGLPPGEGVMWAAPGLGITHARTRGEGRGRATLFYRAGPIGDDRADPAALGRSVRSAFEGAGWETARYLDALAADAESYIDAIAVVRVEEYARGRVALLGDAAWGGTLGGQGTPLALVGACVLASCLATRDDLRAALRAYESTMRPYATAGQEGARHVGGFHAPATRLALSARNAALRALTGPLLRGLFRRVVTRGADEFTLPPPPPDAR